MLSTKNITEVKSVSKTLVPGKQSIKINSITLGKGYEANSYNVYINAEGPDQGEDFEGFLVNFNDKTGPRFKGQIGRIRLSQYAYNDGVTKTGVKVNRDQNILRGLMSLATALGKKEDLDTIESNDIEDFVSQASTVLSGETFINAIVAGKTYDKGGYTQYDLYFPPNKDNKYAYENMSVDSTDSKLITYDPTIHITHKMVSASPTQHVESFEPTTDTSFSL